MLLIPYMAVSLANDAILLFDIDSEMKKIGLFSHKDRHLEPFL